MRVVSVAPTANENPRYEVEVDAGVNGPEAPASVYSVELVGPRRVALCATHGDRCAHAKAVVDHLAKYKRRRTRR